MISTDSALRRLPRGLDAHQRVYFDTIRHAAEMAHVAYGRMVATLTEMVVTRHRGDEVQPIRFSEAFLDAWSFVDCIDRLRLTLRIATSDGRAKRSPATERFLEFSEEVRLLRNVGDHVAQRVAQIVAESMPSLGVLRWLTVTDAAQGIVESCVARPGTSIDATTDIIMPVGLTMQVPTSHVRLASGAHEADLSAVYAAMRDEVSHLESALEATFTRLEVLDDHAGSDFLMMATLQLDLDPPSSSRAI